ncbi:regulator of nonsense transcripts 3, partial [Phenoliferia sp. Uapishka_3]
MSSKPAKASASGSSSPTTQRNKIVVRRLPPALPEAAFWKSVAPWLTREVDIEQDNPDEPHPPRVISSTFRPGKIRRTGKDKDDVHARAYIQFKTPEALVAFHRGYDGWSFRDKQGVVTQVVVEFAPYQKAATESQKKDSRQGTIDTDPDFLAFQASLTAPDPVKVDEITVPDPKAAKSTPLLDHLRAQKAAELASRAGSSKQLFQSAQKAAPPHMSAKKAPQTKGSAKAAGAPSGVGGKKAAKNGGGGKANGSMKGKGKQTGTPSAPQPPALGSSAFPALGAPVPPRTQPASQPPP